MNKPIKEIFSEVLPEFGFNKQKPNNWYKSFPEVVQVVGLQKADWGDYYFVNLALWVKALGGNAAPKFHECHMIRRLDGIALHPNELAAALNEEDSWKMDEAERRRILRLELGNAQFSFFQNLSTVEEIRRYIVNPNEDKHVAVTRVLKEHLGVPVC
jgi:Domain of unknown function (DUF4304)